MNPQELSVFTGISPKYAPHLNPGGAVTAEGVDLSTGKIRPMLAPKLVSAMTPPAGSDSLINYQGTWFAGKGACYTKAHDAGKDLLLYLSDSGRLMKRCGAAVAPVGQTRPVAPGVVVNAADNAAQSLIGPAYRWTRSNKMISLMGSSSYIWIKSGYGDGGRTWYYCLSASRGNPHFNSGSEVVIDRAWFDSFWPVVYAHHSGHSTQLYVNRNEPRSQFGDHDGLGFATLYVSLPSVEYEGYPNEDPSTATKTAYINIRSAEYFLESSSGGSTGIAKPYGMQVEAAVILASLAGTVGDLYPGEWGWGHLDCDCAFDTIYVSLKGGIDPDTKTSGYIAWLRYASDINDDKIYYLITWVRSVGGHVDESGPGAATGPFSIHNAAPTITRPACNDTAVTAWRIYRMESDTGEYLFVAEVPIAQASYIDTTGALSAASCPGWYQGSGGADVIWSPPAIVDAKSVWGPHQGSYFIYRGTRLYWSEPGHLDAWPAQYYADLPFEIVGGAGGAVLTKGGPYRIDGSSPDMFMLVECKGGPCCLGPAALTPDGVAYLSDSGLELFDYYNVASITAAMFDAAWFGSRTINGMAWISGRLYVVCQSEMLEIDSREDKIATTLNWSALAVWGDRENGVLYALTTDGVYAMESSSSELTPWQWRSGELLGDPPQQEDHSINSVEIVGKGCCELTVAVDGRTVARKSLNLDGPEVDRRLLMPEGTSGRAVQVGVMGPRTINVATLGQNLGALPAAGQIVLTLERSAAIAATGAIFTSSAGLNLKVSADELVLERPAALAAVADISDWVPGETREIRVYWQALASARLLVDGYEVK